MKVKIIVVRISFFFPTKTIYPYRHRKHGDGLESFQLDQDSQDNLMSGQILGSRPCLELFNILVFVSKYI